MNKQKIRIDKYTDVRCNEYENKIETEFVSLLTSNINKTFK